MSDPMVFVKLTVAHPQVRRDPILNVQMYRCSKEEVIIGLSGIGTQRLYLIPVESGKGSDLRLRQVTGSTTDLLHVPWDVQYL